MAKLNHPNIVRYHMSWLETIDLDKLNIIDQAQTFAEATHIVSPHGAGLTNLLWCEPGTKVIELTHKAFF